MSRSSRFWRAVAFIALVAAGSAPALAVAKIKGVVGLPGDQPLPENARMKIRFVPLDDPSALVPEVKVRKNGSFFVGRIGRGVYEIEIDSPTYELYRMKIDVEDDRHRPVWDWQGEIIPGQEAQHLKVPGGNAEITMALVVDTTQNIRERHAQRLLAIVAQHIGQGQPEKAEQAVEDLLAERPDDPIGLTLRAYVHQKMGRPAEARQDLERAIEIDPDNADALYQLATLHLEEERTDEALVLLQRVQQAGADPQRRAQALILEGDILAKREQLDEAIAAFEQALELFPDFRRQIVPALADLYTRADQPEKADVLLGQVDETELSPASEFNTAVAFYNKNEFEKAAKHFEKVLELDPSMTEVHRHLGTSYYNLEQLDQAVEHWKIWLEKHPDGEGADQIRALVQALGD